MKPSTILQAVSFSRRKNPHPLRKVGLSLALAIATVGTAHAQILWIGTGPIADDSDVLTNGSYFDATQLQKDHTTSETVNGVVFNDFNNTLTDGTITLSGASEGSDSYGGVGLSASYQAILTDTAYVNASGTGTITIGSVANPLTVGDEYSVQIWLGSSTRQTIYSGVNPLELTGADFGVGTFTATSSTFSFTFTNAPSSTYGEIDAISVRELPEPSTWAMMLGGGAVLLDSGTFVTG